MASFDYVGSKDLVEDEPTPRGAPIRRLEELLGFIRANAADLSEPFTFVVDLSGTLLLAPRRSEHVRAAGGLPVLAAGEIAFDETGSVTYVSNQSLGYRPDETSWHAVADALDGLGVESPEAFDHLFVFRTCRKCGEVNIIKDDWFECSNCGSPLPR